MRISRGALIGVALAFAVTAQALDSKVSRTSPQAVDKLWQKVGNFCGISSWHPAVAKCELSADGKRRTLTLKNGGMAVEELVRWSDARHSYTYRFVSGGLPVANYESTIHIAAAKSKGGSVITWRGHYDAKGTGEAEAKKIIDDIYESGLTSLVGE